MPWLHVSCGNSDTTTLFLAAHNQPLHATTQPPTPSPVSLFTTHVSLGCFTSPSLRCASDAELITVSVGRALQATNSNLILTLSLI